MAGEASCLAGIAWARPSPVSHKAMGKSKATVARRSRRHVNKLRAKGRDAASEFFANSSVADILAVIEESYAHDLVNLWLDLKRSVVRDMFQRVMTHRKRPLKPVITLFHYSEYLTNPPPLVVQGLDGSEIPNYYAIVGLPRDASQDDIREAKRLLLQAHGEETFPRAERRRGAAKLDELREAFSVLGNEARRAKADALLPNMPYLYPRPGQSWLEAVRRYI